MVRKSPVAEEKTPLRDASTSTEAPPPLLARLDKAICDDPLHPFALGRNLRSIIKPAPDQLAVLDGLRAIAVLWVVAVHCCQFVGIEWEWDAGRGGFGVGSTDEDGNIIDQISDRLKAFFNPEADEQAPDETRVGQETRV